MSEPAKIPDFAKGDGLLPAIAQDAKTGEVLMLAYMNPESYAETVATGRAVYFSRSRNKLWRKGKKAATSKKCGRFSSTAMPTRFCSKFTRSAAPPATKDIRAASFGRSRPPGLQVVGERVFDPATVYKKN